ncbi:hypothetical protein EWM62_05875 [Mucilaginibacter terrigena]|uniref:Uncharacterized protein n=1 Tax=Mucilaginibacter terrigena TaxID=2492395 RepID=A0A4Q5LPW3_9SPHI|nr:hypothetical protein [Mucilaginibacter terrigena]RYU91466.1 hypothetical protein EWM62_05875 [Mucilaginibacter terrigena]
MKQTHKLTIALNLFLGLSFAANAQTSAPATQSTELKYRRSSLHLILLESEDFPRKDVVIKAYHEAPFPDKYNNHAIPVTGVDPSGYALSESEKVTAGTRKTGMAAFGANMLSTATAGIVDKDAADMPTITNKIVKDKKIANLLVAKWFNRQPDGSFDMKLVGERGSYDATEMQANIAKGSARGTASLSDAGEELIGNTFVVLTKLKFVSNEPIAAAIREVAKLKANSLPAMFQPAALKLLDIAYNKAKEGYSVWTTSYLYRLKWNDSTAAVFYNDLWMEKGNIDAKRKEAFDKTDLFQMEYIGSEKSSSLVTFSLKQTRTEDQIVELATVRNVEHVFAKLQKTYEVFKPKTPIYSGEPVTAKIGMKEGLEGGEKFEVLEQTIDPKTGLTTYVKKGTVTVDKKKIWDNRFNAGEEVSESDNKDKEKKDKDQPELDRTYFKGGGKFYAGMLLRQIK